MKGSCERGNEPSGSIKCWEVHIIETFTTLAHKYLSIDVAMSSTVPSGKCAC